MAFGRIIELDIGQNNGLGLRISNLNISFEVERSHDFISNYAKIQIFNAKIDTRSKILVKDNNVILKCGYKDENNLSMIFFGIIIESFTRKEDVNYITELLVRDFGSNRDLIIKSKKSFSYVAGTNMSAIVSDIANLIAIPVIGIENLSSIILNNGFVFVGSISNAFRKLNQIAGINDIGIYFDQGELIVYRKGIQDTRFGIVYVSSTSGLLGEVEEIKDNITEKDFNKINENKKTIRFTSLLNPKIIPNTVIKVSSKNVNGAFIVKKVNHIGDNFGGDFVTQVEAIE